MKSILGDFEVKDFKLTDKIADLDNPDLIMVCVKAWQIKEIRDELKKIVTEGCLVLPLQNGVLAAEELSVSIDQKHILGGLCRIISKIESPGVINHLGVTPSIIFGDLHGAPMARLIEIQEVFNQADIKSRIAEDIQSEIWKKFITICVSGLLALTKTTYGELRELKETRKLMIDLITEIYGLSQKIGISIEAGFIEQTVSFIDTFPYDSDASLTRDVWEGKPSEIAYQNGTVVRLGEKYGIATPINRFVYDCILPSELKARGISLKASFN